MSNLSRVLCFILQVIMPTTTFSISKYAEPSFCITGDDRIISEITDYAGMYGFWISSDSREATHIHITHTNGMYNVSYLDTESNTTTPIQCIHNIARNITRYCKDTLPLHAGAVVRNGKADIFLASTGSGKTTLIAYLCQQGYGYLSDDAVYVNTTNLLLNADAKPMHLRLGSMPILQSYGCNIQGKEVKFEDFHRIVYTPQNCTKSGVPINKLYFISRQVGTNSCTKLSPGEALPRIIENLLSPHVDMGSCLRYAARLAGKCYLLTYSDLNFVKEIVQNG